MKIAATVSNCTQVTQSDFRDIHNTKVFDENSTIKEIFEWGKRYGKITHFNEILLSEVD